MRWPLIIAPCMARVAIPATGGGGRFRCDSWAMTRGMWSGRGELRRHFRAMTWCRDSGCGKTGFRWSGSAEKLRRTLRARRSARLCEVRFSRITRVTPCAYGRRRRGRSPFIRGSGGDRIAAPMARRSARPVSGRENALRRALVGGSAPVALRRLPRCIWTKMKALRGDWKICRLPSRPCHKTHL